MAREVLSVRFSSYLRVPEPEGLEAPQVSSLLSNQIWNFLWKKITERYIIILFSFSIFKLQLDFSSYQMNIFLVMPSFRLSPPSTYTNNPHEYSPGNGWASGCRALGGCLASTRGWALCGCSSANWLLGRLARWRLARSLLWQRALKGITGVPEIIKKNWPEVTVLKVSHQVGEAV